MGLVKNLFDVEDGITFFMKKVEAASVVVYREFVWRVFCEILEQTPQWSGKAVANWNISIGSPDFSWDDNLGEPMDAHLLGVHSKGDPEWIEVAKYRNFDKLKLITRREKVYITNGVWGDDDHGRAGSNRYLMALQDPAYWQQKLRAVNKPYEIVDETVLRMFLEADKGVGLSISHLGDATGEKFK